MTDGSQVAARVGGWSAPEDVAIRESRRTATEFWLPESTRIPVPAQDRAGYPNIPDSESAEDPPPELLGNCLIAQAIRAGIGTALPGRRVLLPSASEINSRLPKNGKPRARNDGAVFRRLRALREAGWASPTGSGWVIRWDRLTSKSSTPLRLLRDEEARSATTAGCSPESHWTAEAPVVQFAAAQEAPVAASGSRTTEELAGSAELSLEHALSLACRALATVNAAWPCAGEEVPAVLGGITALAETVAVLTTAAARSRDFSPSAGARSGRDRAVQSDECILQQERYLPGRKTREGISQQLLAGATTPVVHESSSSYPFHYSAPESDPRVARAEQETRDAKMHSVQARDNPGAYSTPGTAGQHVPPAPPEKAVPDTAGCPEGTSAVGSQNAAKRRPAESSGPYPGLADGELDQLLGELVAVCEEYGRNPVTGYDFVPLRNREGVRQALSAVPAEHRLAVVHEVCTAVRLGIAAARSDPSGNRPDSSRFIRSPFGLIVSKARRYTSEAPAAGPGLRKASSPGAVNSPAGPPTTGQAHRRRDGAIASVPGSLTNPQRRPAPAAQTETRASEETGGRVMERDEVCRLLRRWRSALDGERPPDSPAGTGRSSDEAPVQVHGPTAHN